DEGLGHLGLVREDIEPGGSEPPSLQGCGQRRLVDEPAAGDVDEDALRPQRLDDLRIHDVGDTGAAGGAEEEDIALARELDLARIGLEGRILGLRIVVADRHLEARETAGDLAPDPAEAQDARPLAAELAALIHPAL